MFDIINLLINKWRNSISRLKKHNALQAQAYHRKTIDGYSGSATVEAALILPFFLCAVCTVSMIAQFILIDEAVYHATVQTARVYAKQSSVKNSIVYTDQKTQDSSGMKGKVGNILQSRVIFMKYLEKEAVDHSYVLGGRNGVTLSANVDKGYAEIVTKYLLKVPVPFFRTYFFKSSIRIRARTFQGYIEHESSELSSDDQNVVYVSQYGRVYHTRLDCYHLTINITDPNKVKSIMKSSRYKKCDKCIKSGEIPSQMYITKNGDCYHSTLSCGALKRTVNVMSKSDISDKRLCSECEKHSHTK